MTMTKRAWMLATVAVLLFAGVAVLAWRIDRHGESDVALFPDPTARTEHRLQVVKLAIEQFVQNRGRQPASLEELSSGAKTFRQEPRREDGWGRPISYRSLVNGYQLMSAGKDGVPNTADDIVLTVPAPPSR